MRRLLAIAAGLVILGLAPVQAVAHDPDPIFTGGLYTQNKVLQYRWTTSGTPPLDMKGAIHAARDDSNASRKSKAPSFDYDTGAGNVIYYGIDVPCGTNGLACFRRDTPDWFGMWFRPNGYRFEWGTLRWCELSGSPDGCYDAENIALDEFGHVLVLDHHENYADDSDYKDAVVQTYSRTKPKAGYNAHVYGRCDVASLQQAYDLASYTTLYSTCFDVPTEVTLSVERHVCPLGIDGDLHRDPHERGRGPPLEQPDERPDRRPPAADVIGVERCHDAGRDLDQRDVPGKPDRALDPGLPVPVPRAIQRGRRDRRLAGDHDQRVVDVLRVWLPEIDHPHQVSTREAPSMPSSLVRRSALVGPLVLAGLVAGCGTGGRPPLGGPSILPATSSPSVAAIRDRDTRRLRLGHGWTHAGSDRRLVRAADGAPRRGDPARRAGRSGISARTPGARKGRTPPGSCRTAARSRRPGTPVSVTFDPSGAPPAWTVRWAPITAAGAGDVASASQGTDEVTFAVPDQAGAWSLQVEARFGTGHGATWYWRVDVE